MMFLMIFLIIAALALLVVGFLYLSYYAIILAGIIMVVYYIVDSIRRKDWFD